MIGSGQPVRVDLVEIADAVAQAADARPLPHQGVPACVRLAAKELRSAPSRNMFITIDSAAGSNTALRPWMPRMMIRNVSLAASAQASEAAVQRQLRHEQAPAAEQVGGQASEPGPRHSGVMSG